MTENEQKALFALELLKTPDNPFRAASVVFPDDKGRALEVMRAWQHDPVVTAARDKALAELGELHFLPGKADAARRAWAIANDPKMTSDEQLKALRLYSDIRGFIEKQGVTVNNNTLVSANKVMLVKDTGTTEDWEAGVAAQQARLIQDAQRSVN